MPNYKTVFFTLGILQIILGISMMIPIIFQLIFNINGRGSNSNAIVFNCIGRGITISEIECLFVVPAGL